MSKAPNLEVGQAVVCLAEGWNTPPGYNYPLPKKNHIYTIADIHIDKAWQVKWWQFWKRKYFLILAELPNRRGYAAEQFAPVQLLPDAALAELLSDTLSPVTV